MLHWFYFLTANNLLNLALITARKCSEKIIFFLFNFDMKQNHTFVSSLAQIFLCNIFTTIFSKEHLFKIAEFYKKFSFSKTLHISCTVSVYVYSTTGTSFRNIENTVWNNLFLTGLLVTLIYSPVTRYICYMGLVLNFF